jgi:osmotically-inducible protein OsmY
MTMRKLLLFSLLSLVPLLNGCVPLLIGGAVGAGALIATDRRTSGTYIDDQNIELRAYREISHKYRDNSHVNFTSFNGVVLLTGEAANEDIKKEAEKFVRATANVRNVFNEVVVGGNSALGSRTNDTAITSKVKTRFVSNGGRFWANHVKVVTEQGVVYLMGLVTKQEGDAAAEIASTTSGVQRVVRVFEYVV